MRGTDGPRPSRSSAPRSRAVLLRCVLLAAALLASLAASAAAEPASQPGSTAAARLDVGRHHSCAILPGGSVRCWGYGLVGQLGYAGTASIGDDEVPASAGPVDLGAGRSATAISAGDFHTCALLDDGSVRCWGYGANGRLGYGNVQNVGDDETPGSAGPVNLGPGRTATAISAGLGHTCALLDDATVRCWGYGENGALGYANSVTIGDDETPAAAGPVALGAGRTATAISAGGDFTCALLDDGTVRCWGLGLDGRLGYGNTNRIGDDETPASAGPVDIGPGRTATAISAGARATCAVLDTAALRCWGEGREGALGYGDGNYIGDTETPGTAGPVDIGAGRTAVAISVGRHTCSVLDLGRARCWGPNAAGQLGLGHTDRIGDDELPGSVPLLDVGAGATVAAISAGELHTCARLGDGRVRCWGNGANGQLGLCDERDIGDDELPPAVGAVAIGLPGLPAASCPASPPPPVGGGLAPPPAPAGPNSPGGAPDPLADALAAQAARAAALRSCLRDVARKLSAGRRRARGLPAPRRAAALREANRLAARRSSACHRRHGRTPGRVTGLTARAGGRGAVKLSFRSAGSDGSRLPPARGYLVKRAAQPIRSARDFARARAVCGGKCTFDVTRVGATLTLTITRLRPGSIVYLSVAARDDVSGRIGPRSSSIRVRVR